MENNSLKNIILLIILLILSSKGYTDTLQGGEIEDWKLYTQRLRHLNDNPDTTYELLSKYYEKFRIKNDTISQIESLLMMADVKKNAEAYNTAYDHVWDALILAETIQDTFQLAECHTMLGLLYGIFHNENEAIPHNMEALELRKHLLANNNIDEKEIIRNYFSVAASYSRMGNFPTANTYLDSCIQLANRNNQEPNYILSEKAYIAIQQNNLDYADKILTEVSPHFIGKEIRYEVVIKSFWGDLKMKQGLYKEAEQYYKSSLESMVKHNAHTDFRPEVLQKLAKIKAIGGAKDQAYNYLLQAKEINDSLFSAKRNSEFLEVKNRYQEVMQKKNDEIAQQRILLNQRNIQNIRLKFFVGSMLLFMVISALLFWNWTQKKKFTENQHRTAFEAKLEKEKHEEIIEIKNKEITSYTLQLIDKERIIDDLLQELKTQVDDTSFRTIRNRSKDFNKNLWKEFNERFTNVNASFYEKLQEKYPTLSPTDLKYCALIKLNFNGHEMAQLLNMSLPSVHIARHRIRKKFGLERKDNLTKFINDI